MSLMKIQSTKNYRMFHRNADNRPVDTKKHRKLEQSMKEYGFISAFPIVAVRINGKLVVKDGQHRLEFAEALGLPVYWVEAQADFNIATINSTSKTWQFKDFAQTYAAKGFRDYQVGIDFAELHGIAITRAFALLSGHTTTSNIHEAFSSGSFKVKDLAYANSVASIFTPMVNLNHVINNARFLEACMACCRVKNFEAKRLLQNANRCREKLVPYSTRDAYLEMIEAIYNFGRAKLVGLKAEAVMVMRNRNPTTASVLKKKAKTKT